MNLTTLGGRRFLLSLLGYLGTVALVAASKISGEVYATVTIATLAAYITGNTAQKIKGVKE